MKKLCVIYNMAAKYRAPIFQLMDKVLDIDWYYGYQIADIKEMDSSLLKSVTRLQNKMIYHQLYWQSGVIGRLLDKRYDRYLILGELFSLSTWLLLLMKPVIAHKKKIYLWSHGWYGREGRIKRLLKRIFFGLADGTFLYGNYAREQAITQGNNPNKLYVIHNSLDHERQVALRRNLSPSKVFVDYFGNECPTLLFIGRLTKIKRIDLLIEAVKILRDRGNIFNVILIGSGDIIDELKSLVSLLNLENQVWFYGACYDDELNAQLIYDADLCVAPGNVGLTAMHSMVYGTPVVTHSDFTWQMPEFEAIRRGVTGDFFDRNSAYSLAECIEKWFNAHSYSRDMVRQACFDEIDEKWTPQYQINIIKSVLK